MATVSPAILKKLNACIGDFVEIKYPVQDTCIIRPLASFKLRGKETLRSDIIYVDEESMRFLMADLYVIVEVTPTDFDMSFP